MSRQRNERPTTKVCRMCGREFPNTHEYFEWSHRDLNYLQTFCRECSSKRSRQKYERMRSNPVAYEQYLASKRKESVTTKTAEPSTKWAATRARQRNKEDPVWAYENKLCRALRRVVFSKGKNAVRDSCLAPIVGMPVRDLHFYLLDTFKKTYGYEWDGIEPTHIDHIVPLCTENTIDGKNKLFHYTNLRLVKEADNRAKGTSLDYQIGGDASC